MHAYINIGKYICIYCFGDTLLLYNLDWPGTQYVVLKLMTVLLPLLPPHQTFSDIVDKCSGILCLL